MANSINGSDYGILNWDSHRRSPPNAEPSSPDVSLASASLGKGATSEAGKYLFRAASLWWRCAQYFVIASCG